MVEILTSTFYNAISRQYISILSCKASANIRQQLLEDNKVVGGAAELKS